MNSVNCKKRSSSVNGMRTVAVLVCVFCLLVSSSLMAATHTVGIGRDYATITEAIAAAVADDTIEIYGTITLAGDGQSSVTDGVTVDKDLTIQGQGTDQTFVQAAASEGIADRRVFTILVGTTVTLKDMTIRYGNCSGSGGGVYDYGTLIVTDCVICNNKTLAGAGGGVRVHNASAVFSSTKIINNSSINYVGGIYNSAYGGETNSLIMTNCTVSGNIGGIVGGIDNLAVQGSTLMATFDGCTINGNESARDTSSDGGGIRAYLPGDGSNVGTINFTNCTLSGNKARNKGGAIELIRGNAESTLTVNLVNCTIVGNTADSNDDGVHRDYITNHPKGLGGGIFVLSQDHPVLNIKNCLIADNYSGSAAPVPSDLCRDANFAVPFFEPNIDYSVLEVWDARVALNGTNNLTGDQTGLNLAAALADNGGPTKTLALLDDSVAIDAGTDVGAPTTDQTGYNRISPCDIGAYEFGPRACIGTDYNGDGISDLAVFDIATGDWYIRTVADTILVWDANWGYAGAVPVPGDYDGDGVADMAVYDELAGNWYIRTVAGAVLVWDANWGYAGAVPVPGDYDGDGIADMAVFDIATGNWHIRTVAGTVLVRDANWGYVGAVPVSGDYDGDGASDLAVYDELAGDWYIRTVVGTVLAREANWGYAGAVPVPGDYDGDGIADMAVYDKLAGDWYIRTVVGTVLARDANWGYADAVPVPGDYDGDGIADMAVYDELAGDWYIRTVVGTVLVWDVNWGAPLLQAVGVSPMN